MKRSDAVTFMVVVLIAASVFVAVTDHPAYATGGGFYRQTNGTNEGGSTTCAMTLTVSAGNTITTNDYIHLVSLSAGTSVTISSIVITGDAGDTFTKQAESVTYNRVAGYSAQYTGASVSTLTITITYSSSDANTCLVAFMSGVTSGTAETISTGHNTATADNIAGVVGSVTPAADDACMASYGFDAAAGTPSATTDSGLSTAYVYGTRTGGATGRYALTDMFRDDWPASTATTAAWTETKTGATTMRFDAILVCYPAGGSATTTTTTTTSPTTTTTTTTTTSTPATTVSTTTTLTSWSPTVTTTTTSTSITPTTTSTTTTLISYSPTVTSTSVIITTTTTGIATTTTTTYVATSTTTKLTIANIVIRRNATCLSCSSLTMNVKGLLSGYQLAVFVVGHVNSGGSPSFDSLTSNRTGDNFQRVTSSASPDGLSETMLFVTNATSTNVLHLTATWWATQKNATILFYAFDPPMPTAPLLHALGVYQTAGIGGVNPMGYAVMLLLGVGFAYVVTKRRRNTLEIEP